MIVAGGACREKVDKVPPGVIARIGSRMVSVEEFKHYLKRNTGTELAQIQPIAASALLDQYVDEALLSEYAALKHFEVEAEKVTEAVRNDPGSTLTEKRDELRRTRLLADLTAAVEKPADDKVRAFYTEHETEFRQEEQARVRQILIRDEATAKKVQSELRAGVDFEELSKQYSTAPNADRGGEIGFISRGQLPPIFEQAIFSLGPGQVSGIVASDSVFLLFKVVERSSAGSIPFEQARESIRIRLEAEELDRKVAETIGLAGKQFPVTILTKRVPFPYTGGFPRAANE
ncbi:MAG: peptidyl-prolyl cis-trans isomerase [Thermoanaerobaculia bacterium]|jgi:parvulin-like peptidyl-prolyl isomerase